jgi:hypothetical protein
MRKASTIALAVVAAGVLGRMIGCAHLDGSKGDQIVSVGPTEKDVKPDPITIGPGDHVFWRTTPAGRKLQIIFPRAKFPAGVSQQPFESMTVNGTDYLIDCGTNSDSCASGAVSRNLPSGRFEYLYDQILDGKRADGHVVIVKP